MVLMHAELRYAPKLCLLWGCTYAQVLAVAIKDIILLRHSMHDVYRGRLQVTRNRKGQKIRECDREPVDLDWPMVY